jgi:hypothetical protein
MEPDVKTGNNPLYNGDIIDRNIKQAVDAELASRGFVQSQTQPDFLVNYHTYTEKRVSTYGGSSYLGYPGYFGYPGWGYWGYGGMGMMGSGPRTSTYTEGILVIDLIDNASKQTVWRGWAEGNVDNVNRLPKKIRKGVQSIMKQLPADKLEHTGRHSASPAI